MGNAIMGIVTGMTLSLAIAVLMERMLFRGLLRLMFAGPRMLKRAITPERSSLNEIRSAGL